MNYIKIHKTVIEFGNTETSTWINMFSFLYFEDEYIVSCMVLTNSACAQHNVLWNTISTTVDVSYHATIFLHGRDTAYSVESFWWGHDSEAWGHWSCSVSYAAFSVQRGPRRAGSLNRTPTELLMSYSLMTRSIFSPCLCFALLGPGLP